MIKYEILNKNSEFIEDKWLNKLIQKNIPIKDTVNYKITLKYCIPAVISTVIFVNVIVIIIPYTRHGTKVNQWDHYGQ